MRCASACSTKFADLKMMHARKGFPLKSGEALSVYLKRGREIKDTTEDEHGREANREYTVLPTSQGAADLIQL